MTVRSIPSDGTVSAVAFMKSVVDDTVVRDKRGRPSTGKAKTAAERMKAMRSKKAIDCAK
jgi:hypothetical protein